MKSASGERLLIRVDPQQGVLTVHRFQLALRHVVGWLLFSAEQFLETWSQLVEIDVVNRRDVKRERLLKDPAADHGQAQGTA
jgi:hypothetical protein